MSISLLFLKEGLEELLVREINIREIASFDFTQSMFMSITILKE